MSTYEPGTVAVATVRGVPNVRVFRSEGFWRTATEAGGNVTHWDYNGGVTDVRQLVVLDMEPGALGWTSIDYLVQALHTDGFHMLADQIEAQTKPPRIPEPGLWGVVEAGCDGLGRRTWLHVNENPAGNDWASTDGWHRVWADLENPTLVRDGIEVAS